jgi:lysophospholipase L1-like esterase
MLAHVSALRMVRWVGPALLAAVAALILGSGFVLALTGRVGQRLGPPTAAVQPQLRRTGALRVVAVGDSITRGLGDPRAGGYVARIAEALRREGRQVAVTNLAEPGERTAGVLRLIESPEARAQLAAADLILVSAGGNDLTNALRGEGSDQAAPEEALVKTRETLRRIVTTLRTINAEAPIRILGLYNPFEVLAADEGSARAQLLAWNNAIEEATHAHRGVLAVPVADLFDGRVDRLAGDRFHPGPRGHALIAERVLSTLPGDDR